MNWQPDLAGKQLTLITIGLVRAIRTVPSTITLQVVVNTGAIIAGKLIVGTRGRLHITVYIHTGDHATCDMCNKGPPRPSEFR